MSSSLWVGYSGIKWCNERWNTYTVLLLLRSSNPILSFFTLPLKHSWGLFKSPHKDTFIPLRYFYSPAIVPDETLWVTVSLHCIYSHVFLILARPSPHNTPAMLVLDVVACGSFIVKRSFLCFFIPSAPPFPHPPVVCLPVSSQGGR